MTTIEYRAPPRITTALEYKSRSIQLERNQQAVGGDAKPGSMSSRPLKGPQLRSVDRLTQIHEERKAKNDEVNRFRDRSKDWYQRKDRERTAENAEVVHQDIAKKYKDAFKNLSQELKKKMSDVGHSKRHDVDEEGPASGQLQGSHSQESLEQHHPKRPERELSMKYLEATGGALEKQAFQTNVSNESFGPSQTATGGAAAKMNNRTQLGSLMRALELGDSDPSRQSSSYINGKQR